LVSTVAFGLAGSVVAVSAFAARDPSTLAVLGGDSTTTTSASTRTSSTTTTTLPTPPSTTAGTSGGPLAPPASGETPPESTPPEVPYATVDDFDGYITLDLGPTNEIAVGEELTLAAGVTNTSDHPVIAGGLGVDLVCPDLGGYSYGLPITFNDVIAPGETKQGSAVYTIQETDLGEQTCVLAFATVEGRYVAIAAPLSRVKPVTFVVVPAGGATTTTSAPESPPST
jgi:hypothetical protein